MVADARHDTVDCKQTIVDKFDFVERKKRILDQMIGIGASIIKTDRQPEDAERVFSLWQERSKLFEDLVRLTSENEHAKQTFSQSHSSVDNQSEIRERITCVIEQNTKIEVVLTGYRDWLGQKLQVNSNALRYARVHSGEEYIAQLPRGLKVDKPL